MRHFVKQIAVVLLVAWVLGGYPLYLWKGTNVLIAAGVGCAICTLNALAGAWLAMWGMGRDNRTFMTVVFGGMGIRLIIVLIFFFVALKLVKLHVFSLTLSLFLFYVVFQILEIRFFVGCSPDKANNSGV
ncbi:MAG: ATP synthase subunit I [Candidatus Latescibacteria bacterium]|nr:ATP synthase subunit I [Candidatus Latescibacterota bacterium]